jgi:type 1 glutamine amidotransferase
MLTRRKFLYAAPTLAAGPRRAHLVFVCGEHEYSSEQTMPLLAAELEQRYGFAATVLKSHPDQNAEDNLPGLEALNTADLAVFYLRWRRLPWEQLQHIEAYLTSGRPLLGFRTSTHAFNYPAGHPLAAWNRWAADTFGAPPGWGADGHTHFGHKSSTEVWVNPEQGSHPIVSGIREPFQVRSWLYRVVPKWPPPEAARLLIGRAMNPDKPAEENPVAWTWKNKYGSRVFFTTLGHPEDFRVPQVQRLVVQATQWLLDPEKQPVWRGTFSVDVPYRGIVKSSPAR